MFVQAQFKNDIVNFFRTLTDGSDTAFANGLAKVFSDFMNSGVPQTTDAGTVPAGDFQGASTGGSLSSTPDGCASVIYSAFSYMHEHQSGGDAYFANKLALSVQKLIEDTVVSTAVAGLVQPPQGSPVPLAGSATGTFECDTSALASTLQSTFNSMGGMQEGGDELFAEALSSNIYNCFIAGKVKTDGTEALAGSKGEGKAI